MFMKTSPTYTYDPFYLIPSTWSIHFWLIDANTHVLSPLLTTNASHLKHGIVKVESEPEVSLETTDENLSIPITLVIMNPYEAEALMKFTASMSCNGLSSKACTLIDTTTYLDFVSNKDFDTTNDFY